MNGWTAALSLVCGLAPQAFVPVHWRTVRVAGVLYALAVLGAWLIPSQIGSNITRLGMLFGGVVLLAALPGVRLPRPAAPRPTVRKRLALITAICAVTVWQATGAVADAVRTAPTAAWSRDLDPLPHQLERVKIRQQGRLEVVPASSRAADDRQAAVTLASDANPKSEYAVQQVRAALERTGAHELVEAKIEELTEQSLGHFERTGAHPAVRREFAALVRRATGAAPPQPDEAAWKGAGADRPCRRGGRRSVPPACALHLLGGAHGSPWSNGTSVSVTE
ncbi:hypothetical protein [Streptomyces sp. NPDC018321]|uniref:hypothetical protein n=1 Tax=unclassified Streptomyces TaxID=2593676 RepID=UPI0037BC957B